MKEKIVVIEWFDARLKEDRLSMDEVKNLKLIPTYTVGFLLEENDAVIKTCRAVETFLDGEKQYDGIMIIPKPWIITCEYLMKEADLK